MIEVTITFRANKDTLRKYGLLGAPVRLHDRKTFFVTPGEAGDLLFLCGQRGWEVEHRPVFATAVDQIEALVSAAEWKEDDNG